MNFAKTLFWCKSSFKGCPQMMSYRKYNFTRQTNSIEKPHQYPQNQKPFLRINPLFESFFQINRYIKFQFSSFLFQISILFISHLFPFTSSNTIQLLSNKYEIKQQSKKYACVWVMENEFNGKSSFSAICYMSVYIG